MTFAIAFIPAALSFQACSAWAQSPGWRPSPSDDAPSPVVTATAITRDVPIQLKGIGTVVASKTTIVRSDVTGRLAEIDFTAGQQLQAGDLLARVNVRDDRQPSDEREVASIELRSPASGIAGQPLRHVGGMVAPADRTGLVTISRIDPICVAFTLPGGLPSASRRQGIGGHIRVWAYGADKLLPLAEGRLARADDGISRKMDERMLQATFPNPDHALLPGMRVEIQVRGNADRPALTVPVTAVRQSAGKDFVYLVTASRTAHVRPVTLGGVTGGIAVIRDGLAPGDVVITDGQDQLTEGSPVAIVEGPSPRVN